MSLLSVKGLATSFHTREGTVQAVDHISFEVGQGEVVGLVGESGCGKSVTALSTMKLIPGNATTEGSVVFDGQSMLELDEAALRRIRGKSMAMVFQDPMTSLNPALTIGKQLTEVLRVHLDMRKSEARDRSVELLTLVEIPNAAERLDDYPHQFSGGMRQRAMIAMALACGPKLVLADEITTALDVTVSAQILDLLRSVIAASETAAVLITHDLGIIAGMAQRVLVMYAGKIVESAETRNLFNNPRMPYTWGLLQSIPRIDRAQRDMLVPIEGAPPDMTNVPTGCRFAPRCPYRREICQSSEPDLLEVRPAHWVRCWATQPVSEGGWLLEADWQVLSDPRNRNPVTDE